MKSVAGTRFGLARRAVMVAAAIVLAATLAAPAMAVVTTTLTASAGADTIVYGRGTKINAVLMDTGGDVTVGGQWIRLEQATSAAGPWSPLSLVSTDPAASYTGIYPAAVLPLRTTYYSFVFDGTAVYAASTSNRLKIQVRPVLGKPSCPSRVQKGKTFTATGSVKPGAPGGPAVEVRVYRHRGGKWVVYKTFNAKESGAQYSARVKLTQTGTFKAKATVAAGASYASALSGYSRALTVGK